MSPGRWVVTTAWEYSFSFIPDYKVNHQSFGEDVPSHIMNPCEGLEHKNTSSEDTKRIASFCSGANLIWLIYVFVGCKLEILWFLIPRNGRMFDLRCKYTWDMQHDWFLPTASSDNLARLWCVETGEIKREYSGHQKAVVCLAFNDSVLGWGRGKVWRHRKESNGLFGWCSRRYLTRSQKTWKHVPLPCSVL